MMELASSYEVYVSTYKTTPWQHAEGYTVFFHSVLLLQFYNLNYQPHSFHADMYVAFHL
jgi:hypothetical protein